MLSLRVLSKCLPHTATSGAALLIQILHSEFSIPNFATCCSSTLSHRRNPASNYCAAHTRDGGGNTLLSRLVGGAPQVSRSLPTCGDFWRFRSDFPTDARDPPLAIVRLRSSCW